MSVLLMLIITSRGKTRSSLSVQECSVQQRFKVMVKVKLQLQLYELILKEDEKGWDKNLLLYKDTADHNYNKISTVKLHIQRTVKSPHKK